MLKVLAALWLLPVGACLSNDAPTLSVFRQDDRISIRFQRPSDHVFGTVTATVNDVDAGAPVISPGRVGSFAHNVDDVPAYADFSLPLSQQRAAELVIRENGEEFIEVLPDYNAPRALDVRTPVDVLHADDWIEVATGVASDDLAAWFDVTFDGHNCFSSWGDKYNATSVSLKLPPQELFAECGGPDVSIDFSIAPSTVITRCDGPDLTCLPARAPDLELTMPAKLQL